MDQDQLSELYKLVFLTEAGRTVLDDICSMAGMDMLSYNPNDTNKDIMIFNEGKKNIAHYILQNLNRLNNEHITNFILKENRNE